MVLKQLVGKKHSKQEINLRKCSRKILKMSIRAGLDITGLTIPPLKFSFHKKIHLETSWIHLGQKRHIWDTFQAFQVYPATPGNCQVYTGPNKDPDTWVFRFRTFNLNRSWILSQLSYERVLYIKSCV